MTNEQYRILSVVEQYWWTRFDETRITAPSEDKSPQIGVSGGTGDSGEDQETLLQYEPFGLAYVPVKGGPVACLRRHGPSGYAFPLGNGKWRPDDLKVGDVCLYSNKSGTRVTLRGDKDAATSGSVEVKSNGATITIDKDGNVNIDAAPGKALGVNGGTLQVARKTDPVLSTADFVTWATAVKLQIIAAGGGDVGLPPTTIGTINGGADRFKG